MDWQNQDRKTALIIAADKGNLETVKMLLRNGAKPDLQNRYGRTALMNAAGQNNQLAIVKELLVNGAGWVSF